MPIVTSMSILIRTREACSPGRRPSTVLTSTARLRPLAIRASRKSPCRAGVSDESETAAAPSKETTRKSTKSTAQVPADTLQQTCTLDRAWQIGARYARLRPVRVAIDVMNDEYKVEHYPSTIALQGDWTHSSFGRMRSQPNRESPTRVETTKRVGLQLIMGSGAYAAHAH